MKASSNCFPFNKILAALLVAGVTAPTFASTETKPKQNQKSADEKMVVVASRTPKSISEIPATVWYVDSEAIERGNRSGKTLGEILAQEVPSLDMSSGARTNFGQNLRGRPMLVMIDGVSMNSSRGISRQLDSIDPFNIQRVEVLSGASSIYGAGATGGVINIVTKKAEAEELTFESFVSGQSGFNSSEDGDFKLAQSVSGGNEKVRGRAALVYGKTQGLYDAKGKMVVPDMTQGSLQFNETVDAMGNMTVDVSETKKLNFTAQYFSSQQKSPYGLYHGPNYSQSPEVRKGFESDRQMGTKRVLINAEYVDEAFFGQQLLAQVSYRNEDYTYSPGYLRVSQGSFDPSGNSDVPYMSASQQKSEVFSFKTALVKKWNAFSLTYGVDGYHDRFSSNQTVYDPAKSAASGGLVNKPMFSTGRYPGVQTDSLAAYVQGEYNITDAWSVSGGYRFQSMKNTVDDFVDYREQVKIAFGQANSADVIKGGDATYDIGLFNLGTVYKLNDISSVWGNVSQGFDLPDAAKYYGQGKYKNGANGHRELVKSYDINTATLKGVKTNSYELGYRIDTADISFQTAAYYSLSDQTITKNNYQVVVKDQDTRIYGLEAALAYYITQNWDVGVNGHLVETETKSQTSGKWEKTDIGNASNSKVGAWLGWNESIYTARLQSQTMLSRTDENGKTLNGYTTVDFVTTVDLPVGNLAISINNLFNEDYTTVWGQKAQHLYGDKALYNYKGRGRTVSINYQVRY